MGEHIILYFKDTTVKLSLEEAKGIYQSLKSFPILNDEKHYLGDVKWVLYQYICNLGSHDVYTFRCGNYAFNKISGMSGFHLGRKETRIYNLGNLDLNGESVVVIKNEKLDKKQIIISAGIRECYEDETNLNDTTIYPDDIVLYFA